MSATSVAAAPVPAPYLTTRELAARWGVSVVTARNMTRTEGFPSPLALGPRSLRWLADEVAEFEKGARKQRRHVVTGSRPQHHLGAPAPVRTRTIRRAA